jgi:hypothetical protein
MEPRRGHPVVTQPVKNAPRPLARRRRELGAPGGGDMRLNLRVARDTARGRCDALIERGSALQCFVFG